MTHPRYVCIHGHFYQPPRENPWLGAVEAQDSAAPFHDWNERITAECYAPNSAARVLDGQGRIERIVDNYRRISFNLGPTLLSWLDQHRPDVHRAVVESDHASRQAHRGHGSALAQPYNHMIMPLANARDRRTQIAWGVRDFERRFGRRPEGMWLPETAVDLATLDDLSVAGIAFTILAPHQAARVRPLTDPAGATWETVGSGVDPTMPYRVSLPSGRTIVVFFYDGPISRAVAFEQLLTDGLRLSGRLLGSASERLDRPQLLHIATDGESYGHHHRFGDMALAVALDDLERRDDVRLTNYGEFLELFPPTHEAEIAENTSWSCAHGIERWRSDCGCNGGGPSGHGGWHQRWRGGLRATFDWLRDTLAGPYERELSLLVDDPWLARDDYIDVVLERSEAAIGAFFERHASRSLTGIEVVRALHLLELQRFLVLMYTSCGWFFDEVSGIETTQVLRYAGCAVQLAEDTLGLRPGLEAELRERLAAVPGNLAELPNAAIVYDRFIAPARVDLVRVGANYAVTTLFPNGSTGPNAHAPISHGVVQPPAPNGARADVRPTERTSRSGLAGLFDGSAGTALMYQFEIDRLDHRIIHAGRARVAIGRVRVVSGTTRESTTLSYGLLHLGDHSLTGGARPSPGPAAYDDMVADVSAAFQQADVPGTIRALDRHFAGFPLSLNSLFRDLRRRVVDDVLAATLAETEAVHRSLYDDQAPLLRFLASLSVPLPASLRATAELVVAADLRRALHPVRIDPAEVQRLLDEAHDLGLVLPADTLAFTASATLSDLASHLEDAPHSPAVQAELARAVDATARLPFPVERWSAQNVVNRWLGDTVPPDPALVALAESLGFAPQIAASPTRSASSR